LVGNDVPVEFHEVRYVRGELPGPVLVVFAAVLGALGLLLELPVGWRALSLALAALILWLSSARLVTVVAEHRLTMRVPFVWRRAIDLADVAAAEVVIVDSWPFGGGSSAALVEAVDPGRDRGNRAVRVELKDGRVTQLYSHDPRALCEAIVSG
jgi:hypothetical protein